MAKFEDYVTKDDQLQSEIDEAGNAAQDRQDNPELPERFQGKTAAEIAKSYEELEKAYSRQGNDLGEMRKTMDEFIRLQSEPQTSQEPSQAEPVTVDELYEDPNAAIERVVDSKTTSRIKELEEELVAARIQSRVDALNVKFPGWREKTNDPAFANWVAESPYRARLGQAADQYDMDAAEELLGLYYDAQQISDGQAEAHREQQLRDATLESSSPEPTDVEPRFSRRKLTEYRIAAKRGDMEADLFLRQNADAIAFAYEDNRIDD